MNNYYQKNKQNFIDYYQKNKQIIAESYKNNKNNKRERVRLYNIKYNQIHKQELSLKRSLISCYGKLYYDQYCKNML